MKFMSKFENAVYVVEPRDTIFSPGGRKNLIRGLRAEFRGRDHIFDSERSQKAYRWNDDTRKRVEEYLIEHEDFGHLYYLAPGEEPTDRVKKLMEKAAPMATVPFFRCAKLDVIDDKFEQCPETAVFGKDFCERHLPSGIVQGMGTTTSSQAVQTQG